MYRALYRKWRPQRFEDVVAQSTTVTALRSQIMNGRVGHAYLFTGVRGTGKTTCAKIFAKAVNCRNPVNGDPCCECDICRGIDNETILDVVEMDAASNNGVDDIRDLRDETIYTPSTCNYKVYIIDEVHMLSTSAFNALLKTLEEPPAHVIFILATTELHKVPATILSRCQRYNFMRIQPEDIAGRIKQVAEAEGLNLTDKAADMISRVADGAMRDALSILDTCAGVTTDIDEAVVQTMAGVTDRNYLFRISDAVQSGTVSDIFTELAQLREQSVDMKRLTDELISHYRNIMLAAIPGQKHLLTGVTPDEEAQYTAAGKTIPQQASIRAIRALGSALERMKENDPRIELELALLGLAQRDAFAAPAASAQPAAPVFAAAAAPAPVSPSQVPFAAAPIATPAPAAQPVPAAEAVQAPAAPASPIQIPAESPLAYTPQELAQNAAPASPASAAQPPQSKPAASALQTPAQQNRRPAAMPAIQQAAPVLFEPWPEVVAYLKDRGQVLFPYVAKSTAYFDGKRVLIDGGAVLRDMLRQNSDHKRLIKKAILKVTGTTYPIGPYESGNNADDSEKVSAEASLRKLEMLGLTVDGMDDTH